MWRASIFFADFEVHAGDFWEGQCHHIIQLCGISASLKHNVVKASYIFFPVVQVSVVSHCLHCNTDQISWVNYVN